MYKFRIFYKHNGSVSSTHSASFRLLVDIWCLLRCRCQEFFMLNKQHFRIASCQIFYHLRCYHGNSWPTLETIAWCDSREKFRNHLEKASVMWNLFYTSARRTSSAKHLCTQVADEERKKNVFSMSRWRWARRNKRANTKAVTQYVTWNYSRELWR